MRKKEAKQKKIVGWLNSTTWYSKKGQNYGLKRLEIKRSLITKNWQEGCSLDKQKTYKFRRKLYCVTTMSIKLCITLHDVQAQYKLWIWYDYDMSL